MPTEFVTIKLDPGMTQREIEFVVELGVAEQFKGRQFHCEIGHDDGCPLLGPEAGPDVECTCDEIDVELTDVAESGGLH